MGCPTEPINTFHGIQHNEDEPIRVSYHRNIHYNSVVNPNKATIGVGLGLPSFKPGVSGVGGDCDPNAMGWGLSSFNPRVTQAPHCHGAGVLYGSCSPPSLCGWGQGGGVATWDPLYLAEGCV